MVLVNTPAMPASARFFAVRKSVRGFTDSLLDLIVKDRYCDRDVNFTLIFFRFIKLIRLKQYHMIVTTQFKIT